MSIWAERRKQAIIWVIILIIFVVISLAAWSVFHKPPTCNDGRRNQDEQGIDCGGVCSLMCKNNVLDPVILWQRFFKVSEGVYTAATMIQNPNLYSYAANVPYRIRVYDEDGVTIFDREGYMDIYPKYSFPLIEPGIRTGERTPTRMTFEFTQDPVWYRSSEHVEGAIDGLSIINDVILNEVTSPRIDSEIRNDTNAVRQEIKVAALVYDPEGNVMAVSQTVVDTIPPHGSSRVIFSWPEPFPYPILKKELIILPY